MNDINLIGDFGKPATMLIEKISDALGGFFLPRQIQRVAKAEAAAKVTHAQADLAVKQLQENAMNRWVCEESAQQQNMEAITMKAIPLLREDSQPLEIEQDWLAFFLQKSRIISDEEMQHIWANILSAEANSPGKFSKYTINIVSMLSNKDAEMFVNLCKFVFLKSDIPTLIIIDFNNDIYAEHNIDFNTLKHLDFLRLISFEPSNGYVLNEQVDLVILTYSEKSIKINLHGIPVDNVWRRNTAYTTALFTKPGLELFSITERCYIPNLEEYVFDALRDKQFKVELI